MKNRRRRSARDPLWQAGGHPSTARRPLPSTRSATTLRNCSSLGRRLLRRPRVALQTPRAGQTLLPVRHTRMALWSR
eukprot:11402342-Heterocapsa_arctica.AAC.1